MVGKHKSMRTHTPRNRGIATERTEFTDDDDDSTMEHHAVSWRIERERSGGKTSKAKVVFFLEIFQ
jgi:hypothetical protein